MILYQEDYIKITYKPELHLQVLEWSGLVLSEQYREGLSFAIELAIQNKVTNWIANLQNRSQLNNVDKDWYITTLYPKFRNTYLKKIGIIIPEHSDYQSDIRYVYKPPVLTDIFEQRYFYNYEEALNWMQAVYISKT